MKTNQIFKLPAVALLLLTTGAGTQKSVAQTETILPSTVMRLKGHARCSTDNAQTWRMLKEGEILSPGSLIQTAQKSQLDLLLGEEVKPSKRGLKAKDFYNPELQPSANLVGLAEGTLLRIEKLARKQTDGSKEPEEDILLDLRSGMILGNVGKLKGGSKYEVGFVGGVAGTRDAIYELRASGEVAVRKGTVFLALADSQPVKAITQGHQFNPGTGVMAELPSQPPRSPADSTSSSDTPDAKPALGSTPSSDAALPFGRARPPARP